MRFIFLVLLSVMLTSCAYRIGYGYRSLPGGYKEIAIPVFANKTQEVGVEAYFTNAILKEFERSKVANISPKNSAPVTLLGTIDSVRYVNELSPATSKEISTLPSNTVLTTQVRIIVETIILIRKNADNSTVWQGKFRDERVYSAPQIGSAIVNTANPLYNQSARRQNIEQMASRLMAEAHDRITENF